MRSAPILIGKSISKNRLACFVIRIPLPPPHFVTPWQTQDTGVFGHCGVPFHKSSLLARLELRNGNVFLILAPALGSLQNGVALIGNVRVEVEESLVNAAEMSNIQVAVGNLLPSLATCLSGSRSRATQQINGTSQDVAAAVKALAPHGADVVFECTGLPQCIDPAIALCRTHGKFVWQGNYGAAPLSMHFLPPHGRRLQMFFPCDDGLQPCRRAVVKNMAMGALRWEKCITHRVSADEAPALFQQINEGSVDEIVGAVINWLT